MVKLWEIADLIADHFKLPREEVVSVLLNVDAVNDSCDEPPRKRACSSSVIPLKDIVGQPVEHLNVSELRHALQGVSLQEEVLPFLLRFVLGEFHYGQRATKLLSGQKPMKKDSEEQEFEADTAHQSKVAKAFDVLANESRFCHLHQQAGWIDINSIAVWDSYVKDVMDGKLQDGDRLFEAGCGVLAFLRSAEKLAKNVAIGGLDGAPKTIQLIKDQFLSAADADNFFVGFLPDALAKCESNSWDIVVCNSVFQYFADADQARKAVNEMVRVAKRWVIIADILDEKYSDLAQGYARSLGGTAGVDLPKYLGYWRSWWEQFEVDNHLVSIRKVESKTYVRRKERYTVYIEKNAEVITPQESAH
eukprot:GEMP01024174.1.p1 GENE.GEMP01024174.1~~GEMP01024174.1.p1  ORF type:complete len:362 (+),score=82.39 GEMP01024174.1:56-1141(+)